MTPSKSSIDRLAKFVSEAWEDDLKMLETKLRAAIEVPPAAVSIAVSLDGVFVPMDRTNRTPETLACAAASDEAGEGSSGYREVACGTIAFCDAAGEMISAIRMARAPEQHKATLKAMLTETVRIVKEKRPDLAVVKIADGAPDNWTFLASDALPPGPQILDNFHANEHLHEALAVAHGAETTNTKLEFQHWRGVLRWDDGGADKVIEELERLSQERPRSKVLIREIKYFEKNKHRMNYLPMGRAGFMIGSGVVEAACKTVATQRLKQSGMRWSQAGAQAILTPRSWDQSGRFDQAWAILAATFETKISIYRPLTLVKPQPTPIPANDASR